MMANLFILKFPNCNSSLRIVSASASSNGAHPLSAGTGTGTGSGPVILELPLEKIRRPLMRTRANDLNKVKELMDSIQEIGLQVPIDVLEVDGIYYENVLEWFMEQVDQDDDEFDSSGRKQRRTIIHMLRQVDQDDEACFSGCHRYEAHQRLGLPTIRCKIRRGTKETLRHHMR